jgi:hypothetical protein
MLAIEQHANRNFVFCYSNFLHRHYEYLNKHKLRWQCRKHRFIHGLNVSVMSVVSDAIRAAGWKVSLMLRVLSRRVYCKQKMYVKILHHLRDAVRLKNGCTTASAFLLHDSAPDHQSLVVKQHNTTAPEHLPNSTSCHCLIFSSFCD